MNHGVSRIGIVGSKNKRILVRYDCFIKPWVFYTCSGSPTTHQKAASALKLLAVSIFRRRKVKCSTVHLSKLQSFDP